MKENNNIPRPEFPLWSFTYKTSSKVEAWSRKEIEFKLITRALKEKDFKQSLLKDGKAAVEAMFHLRFPETLSLTVKEETEDLIYLVLPHNPYAGIPEQEIQDSLGMDLEDLAAWLLDQQKELLPEDKRNNVQLVAKAWRDEAFKRLLITDPKLVIEQEFGEKTGGAVHIEVLEETEGKIYMVIPAGSDPVFGKTEIDIRSINLPIVIGSGTGGGSRNPFRMPL